MVKKGKFIVVEGTECAGKTTQTKSVSAALREKGISVVETREPGGSEIGEQVRAILKDPSFKNVMDPVTSLLLFNAARRQFIKEIVLPALNAGKTVISDRFLFSTIAYQGYAEGLDISFVKELCFYTVAGCMPDKVFFLDITVDEMLRRQNKRGGAELDRYDQLGREFHQRVWSGYHALAKEYPATIEPVDGARSAEDITKELTEKILRLP